ncbi:MAG: SDR family NAD(P)-dependent oxidoreductase [Sphingomonas sp.]|nr:SDR family NAD(P)-dependent oxidoreductase [Sphingomonas sp.]
MARLLIFGLGYSASRIAAALVARGWQVTGTTRTGRDGTIAFDDRDRVHAAIGTASHVLHSVPPDDAGDPVLEAYGEALKSVGWFGYLSSTGVYGDTGGAWVDEQAPLNARRTARQAADAAWLAHGARVFRLPGIYGPGRSALDRVIAGRAHRIDLPDQVFSRIHVDDIASGVLAGLAAAPGAYNLADDHPCSQNAVIEYACALLGRAPPPLMTMDEAALSPMARGFYAENRRVANNKAKRLLGWRPLYPDYRAGLRALRAITSPDIASAAPAAGNTDQR